MRFNMIRKNTLLVRRKRPSPEASLSSPSSKSRSPNPSSVNGESNKGHKPGTQRRPSVIDQQFNYLFHCTKFTISAVLGVFLLSMGGIIYLHNKYTPIPYPDHLHGGFSRLSGAEQSQTLRQLFLSEFQERIEQRMSSPDTVPSDFDVAMTIMSIYLQHKSDVNFLQIGAIGRDWKDWTDPMAKLIATSQHWHGSMMEPDRDSYLRMKDSIDREINGNEDRILSINAEVDATTSVLDAFSESTKSARDGTVDVLIVNAKLFGHQMLKQFMMENDMKPLLVVYNGLKMEREEMESVQSAPSFTRWAVFNDQITPRGFA